MKRMGFAATLIGFAGFLAVVTSVAAASTPRWVNHVRNYPGGISSGVRAYLDPGARAARASARKSDSGVFTPSSPFAPGSSLQNRQVNGQDSDPKVPQNETQVVHSEFNDRVAIAGANDYVNGGSQLYRTNDGGRTWHTQYRSPAVEETGDFCGGGGDPALAYSRRDRAFYFAQLCFFRAFLPSEIEVIQSTDNGRSWTGSRTGAYPVSNFSPALQDFNPALFYDKEQITVDNHPSSPHYGRIYVTYIKFHIQPSGFSDYCPVNVSYTDDIDPNNDGDLTDSVWHRSKVVPDNPGGNGVGASANQGAQPVVDNQGGLDISYMTEECNTAIDHGIFLRRSTNGGTSFGPAHKINKPGQWKDNPNPDDLLAPKEARIPASTSAPLVFNPVDNSLNYIVQNNINGANTGADISFTKSMDYGATWSSMHDVAVNPAGNPAPKDQFFPWMDVDPRGNLHAIWYDNRDTQTNLRIRTFQGRSGKSGITWSNKNISTKRWNPNKSFFDSGAFIGDYNGYAVGDGVAYPIWTDGRNTPGPPLGQTDIWTNVEIQGSP
jgi:hypothetical protein